MDKMIIGSATRYIAGRNAVQTVYWRKTKDIREKGFLKYNKTCNFGKNEPSLDQNSEMFTKLRKHYS